MERLPLKSKVLNENQIVAESLRERFREHGVLCLNLISGPGSGKTALLERTLASLDRTTRVCVLTGDIQTDNDARWHLPSRRADDRKTSGRVEPG
jgi:hydrogenase nickel incorporation protein HypB